MMHLKPLCNLDLHCVFAYLHVMNPEEIKRYFDSSFPPMEVDWKP